MSERIARFYVAYPHGQIFAKIDSVGKIASVKSMYDHLCREKWKTENPFRKAVLPKRNENFRNSSHENEIKEFLDAIDQTTIKGNAISRCSNCSTDRDFASARS
ncbi:MAG: hypothetical protein MZU97_16655 [Bacillus subtilis]|nr:hypothetical protein [Bacillus subtilis]